jgi:hypothetical protein
MFLIKISVSTFSVCWHIDNSTNPSSHLVLCLGKPIVKSTCSLLWYQGSSIYTSPKIWPVSTLPPSKLPMKNKKSYVFSLPRFTDLLALLRSLSMWVISKSLLVLRGIINLKMRTKFCLEVYLYCTNAYAITPKQSLKRLYLGAGKENVNKNWPTEVYFFSNIREDTHHGKVNSCH